MKLKQVSFIILFTILSASLFGDELLRCQIANQTKHQHNQTILNTIINQELSTVNPTTTPEEKAAYLSVRIREIAQKLLASGFTSDAYEIPEFNKNQLLSFSAFPLWEGKDAAIPVTFIVYVWPPEKVALKYISDTSYNRFYASCIHRHPISCAITCLKGTITQQNYRLSKAFPMKERVVELINEEQFNPGEGDVDDNSKPFIHRLVCRHNDTCPCLTLHAYGAGSKDEAFKIFNETCDTCEYCRVVRPDMVQLITYKNFWNQCNASSDTCSRQPGSSNR